MGAYRRERTAYRNKMNNEIWNGVFVFVVIVIIIALAFGYWR